jgi:hypothetical protein
MSQFVRCWLCVLLMALPVWALADDEVAPNTDPEVTIRHTEDKTIQEYRINGFLYAIKVTPKVGKPYFLVRSDGTQGDFIRSDEPNMLIPSWVIFSW